MASRGPDILLATLPFAPYWMPNAGIAVLKGAALRAGLSVRATYPSMRLGRKLGNGLYNFISECYLSRRILIADWAFAGVLDGRPAETPEGYEELYLVGYRRFPPDAQGLMPSDAAPLSGLRRLCEEFVEEEARRAVALAPRIVGCSSNFFQHAASAAFLKRVKALRPDIVTMIGGANCEADMGCETARQFPWIDYVFSGEADETFPRLCRRILEGGPVPDAEVPYGVYTPAKARARADAGKDGGGYEVTMVEDLDAAGAPDYDEYFAELEEGGVTDPGARSLPVESARGCHKGQRSLCAFCGLNGSRVAYRTKSKARFMAEVRSLSQRHGCRVFLLTDNIVAEEGFAGWIKEAAAEKRWAFFLEVRSTLDESRVQALADAQAFNLQPGIENLNDHLLGLMNKGNSALGNIALLKYGQERAIWVTWNLLRDIPGERAEDYREMADLIPLLHHLQPPHYCSPISFCKFSRYHQAPERYGLKLSPIPGYRFVYPALDEESLHRLAYHFVAEDPAGAAPAPLAEAKRLMLQRVQEWIALRSFARGGDSNAAIGWLPALTMTEVNGLIKIRDSRSCAVSPHFCLDELESRVYREARAPVAIARLQERSARAHEPGPAFPPGDIARCVEDLLDSRLMIRMGERVLSLATYPRRLPSETQMLGLNYLQWRSEFIYSQK